MVNKLDAILKLLFDHFHQQPSFTSPPSLSPTPSTPALSSPPLSPTSTPVTPPRSSTPLSAGLIDNHVQQLAQFHTLLAIFTRTILCTFKSRYTQFLLFWFASRHTAFADLFLGELVAHALLEPTESEIARAAAASYVASFVSRAKFIGPSEARGAVRVLCRFLEHEADAYEAGDGSTAPPGVFYAVAQAVFLIFCFRWRDLVEADDNPDAEGERERELDSLSGPAMRMWMAELSIVQRVIACPLQPLKVPSFLFTHITYLTDLPTSSVPRMWRASSRGWRTLQVLCMSSRYSPHRHQWPAPSGNAPCSPVVTASAL